MAGGNLEIEWDAKTSHVFMTGTSKEVFSGTMNVKLKHEDVN